MIVSLFLLVSIMLAGVASAETIALECEQFENRGGWSLDSQFIDEMGSSYLLAHGLGKPVADATTTFEVKIPGKYNVFVRTKNWTAKWVKKVEVKRVGGGGEKCSAGRFNLIVNGVKLPNLLGVQGSGEWLWVKVDDVPLNVGSNTLALHDVSGFDGRCDAVCFTTENVLDPDALRSSIQTSKHAPPTLSWSVAASRVSARRFRRRVSGSRSRLCRIVPFSEARTQARCAFIWVDIRTSVPIRGWAMS